MASPPPTPPPPALPANVPVVYQTMVRTGLSPLMALVLQFQGFFEDLLVPFLRLEDLVTLCATSRLFCLGEAMVHHDVPWVYEMQRRQAAWAIRCIPSRGLATHRSLPALLRTALATTRWIVPGQEGEAMFEAVRNDRGDLVTALAIRGFDWASVCVFVRAWLAYAPRGAFVHYTKFDAYLNYAVSTGNDLALNGYNAMVIVGLVCGVRLSSLGALAEAGENAGFDRQHQGRVFGLALTDLSAEELTLVLPHLVSRWGLDPTPFRADILERAVAENSEGLLGLLSGADWARPAL